MDASTPDVACSSLAAQAVASGSRCHLDWSLIASAGAFSSFAALLAGITFAGMVLLLARELYAYRGPERAKLFQSTMGGRFVSKVDPLIGRPIAFMIGALFSLVVAAFLFAAITGETFDAPAPDVKQFVEGALPSMALSIGVVQMAVSLAWLIQVRGLESTALRLVRRIVDATVVLAGNFLIGVVLSPLFQLRGKTAFPVDGWQAWIGLAAFVVAVALSGGWLVRREIAPGENTQQSQRGVLGGNDARFRDRQDRVIWVANIASIVTVLLAAIAWNIVTAFDTSALESIYRNPLGVLVFAILIGAMFAALEAAMPPSSG